MASIKDVAKHANVGIATVSRVINNSGFVSKETKELVLQSIAELDYTPNEVARNFKRQQTNIIGLIVPSVMQEYTAELTCHLEEDLFNLGYHTLFCISNHNAAKELEYLEKLKSHQVSGVIITAPFITKDESLMFNDLPIVSVDRYVNEKMPCIHVDNYKASIEITNHLLKNTFNKVAYIGFGADAQSVSHQRKDAFIDACNKQKRTFTLVEMYYEERIPDYLKRVYETTRDCDGYYFSCDAHAHLFISYMCSKDLHFKQDYQLVAFDGLSKNDLYHYTLTSIKQPLAQISKAVVTTLMRRMNRSEFDKDVVVPYIFVEGDTCGKK